jgi:hypothetical protein
MRAEYIIFGVSRGAFAVFSVTRAGSRVVSFHEA